MFHDRADAGDRLAERLLSADIVCAIPRGGVPVAARIAARLRLPLSIIAVKKIVNPADPEYALGAAGAVRIDAPSSTPSVWVDSARDRARRLEERFGAADLDGKHVVLVDDGAATGLTFLLAIDIARDRGASKVTAAVPVASTDAARAIRRHADATLILEIPSPFGAVGSFYERFDQTSDEEVARLLAAHR